MTTDAVPGRNGAPSIVINLNALVARLLRIGIPMGPNVLLTVRGRTSGQPRTFPVALLEHDGRRYVFCPYGEANWVRNLRAAGTATLRRGNRDEEVIAVELTADEGAAVLEAVLSPMLASRVRRPFVRRFYALRADASPADYLDQARSHPGFELRRQYNQGEAR